MQGGRAVTNAAADGLKLTFRPVIEFDATTKTYGAWSDELDVATSGATVEEAKAMLADALLMAAAFTVQHKNTLRWDLLAQLPYAEIIHGKSPQQVAAIIDVYVQLRTDKPGA